MGVDTYAAVRDIITISWPILLFLALLWAIVAIARRSSADRRWLDSLRFGWTVRQWRRS